MNMPRALWSILAVSLGGVAFSGVLTYRELFHDSNACSPLGQAGTLFGYPPCIYGLVMYGVVAMLAAWGLAAKR